VHRGELLVGLLWIFCMRSADGDAVVGDKADSLFDDGVSDADSRERWKRALQAQEEGQTLLHQTVVASKRQNLELQYERVRCGQPSSSSPSS
jgi:hypothetical protein